MWDYDFASAPTLATMTVDGKTVDVVAQVSKQGFTYVFDRVTGQPIWPIEERPVDTTTDVPGERVVPDAAVSDPAAAARAAGDLARRRQRSHAGDQALAEEQLKRFRLGPLYTPPSLKGTIQRPSQNGAANWGGAAFDPAERMAVRQGGRIATTSARSARTICRIRTSTWEYSNYCGQYGLFTSRAPQGPGAPAQPVSPAPGRAPDTVNYSGAALGGIPLTKPPYAYLVAVDLNKGDIAWRVPFGEGSQAIRQHPLLKGVTLPERLGTTGNFGGIVTRGGLVLIGGGDPYLYAFDKATGREIARVRDAVPDQRQPHDLSDARGPPVRRDRDRGRHRRHASRVRAEERTPASGTAMR